jgi:orotidine-5'-phosphate decarboxylase
MNNPLIFALDVEPQEAKPLIEELKGVVGIIKIGSRLFTALGPQVVDWVHAAGAKVFLDLKFHDIPLTVSESCRNVARMGVWGFTIHASGGFAMMKEAAAAVRDEAGRIGKTKPLVFGVTVLTSLSEAEIREIGFNRTPLEQVRHLAALAQRSGLDGVVSSGNELAAIREVCGSDFLTVVPGIRPASELKPGEDQKRVMTPKNAMAQGANYLVVGRPILQAKDRSAAARSILQEVGLK